MLRHTNASGRKVTNFLRSRLAALGKFANFGSHDGEPSVLIAGACRLNGGVERKKIGLICDFFDDRDPRYPYGDPGVTLRRVLYRVNCVLKFPEPWSLIA